MGRKSTTHCPIPLEEDDSAALVTSGEVITRLVELDSRYDIGCVQGVVSVTLRVVRNSQWSRAGVGRLDAEQPNAPSVISSTSPLSPKHLEATQLAVVQRLISDQRCA